MLAHTHGASGERAGASPGSKRLGSAACRELRQRRDAGVDDVGGKTGERRQDGERLRRSLTKGLLYRLEEQVVACLGERQQDSCQHLHPGKKARGGLVPAKYAEPPGQSIITSSARRVRRGHAGMVGKLLPRCGTAVPTCITTSISWNCPAGSSPPAGEPAARQDEQWGDGSGLRVAPQATGCRHACAALTRLSGRAIL